jgi:Rv2258c-like winged HTH domain
MTNQQNIDQAKSDAFAHQMLDMLNHAALSLMISIGQKTRLFDTMSRMAPATSEQIASATGLHERYVREWLGAMVTGRVIEYDPAQGTYHLPAEHAAWLTRDAGTNNLAFQAQYIVMLANVQEEIVDCFSRGGGVPYSSFPDFQRLMAEESTQVVDSSLLQVTLPLIPGLVERLQAGISSFARSPQICYARGRENRGSGPIWQCPRPPDRRSPTERAPQTVTSVADRFWASQCS